MVTIGINWIVIAQLTLQKLPIIHLLALHMSRIGGRYHWNCCCWFSSWNILSYSPLEHVWNPIKWTHGLMAHVKSVKELILGHTPFLFYLFMIFAHFKDKKRGMLFIASEFSPVERILLLSPKPRSLNQSNLVKSTSHGIDSNHGPAKS